MAILVVGARALPSFPFCFCFASASASGGRYIAFHCVSSRYMRFYCVSPPFQNCFPHYFAFRHGGKHDLTFQTQNDGGVGYQLFVCVAD